MHVKLLLTCENNNKLPVFMFGFLYFISRELQPYFFTPNAKLFTFSGYHGNFLYVVFLLLYGHFYIIENIDGMVAMQTFLYQLEHLI